MSKASEFVDQCKASGMSWRDGRAVVRVDGHLSIAAYTLSPEDALALADFIYDMYGEECPDDEVPF